MTASARGKPVLVYDGDCAFCAACVRRLRSWTGDAVSYAPSPDASLRAVQLVVCDGETYAGARAVFETLACAGRRGLLWAYKRIPGFAAASEWIYKLVARVTHAGSRSGSRL